MNYAMLLARSKPSQALPESAPSPEGWDISTATFSQSFNVASEDAFPQALFFKPDGLKMYVIGTGGSEVVEYSLGTAWDISTATFSQSFSVSAQEAFCRGLFFEPSGIAMYVIGNGGDDVNEYSLGTAWDVSSASYEQVFSISSQETSPTGLFFKPDGQRMYVVGHGGIDVNEYSLSTAWDVSSASYVQAFSVSAQDTQPNDVFFKPDGTRMYIVGDDGDDVNEYSLSDAWDISTANYVQAFSVASKESSPRGVFFRNDGLKMYVVGLSGSVHEYNLSLV